MTETKAPAHDPDSQPTFSLTPHLVCAGAADAIEFYKKAFNASEMIRLPGPDGKLVHAAVLINKAMVMLVDEMPEHGMLGPKTLKGTPVTIHLMAPDVDKSIAQAASAGATVIMPAADQFWGDRYGVVEDPFGHRWSIATPIVKRNWTSEQLAEAMRTGKAN